MRTITSLQDYQNTLSVLATEAGARDRQIDLMLNFAVNGKKVKLYASPQVARALGEALPFIGAIAQHPILFAGGGELTHAKGPDMGERNYQSLSNYISDLPEFNTRGMIDQEVSMIIKTIEDGAASMSFHFTPYSTDEPRMLITPLNDWDDARWAQENTAIPADKIECPLLSKNDYFRLSMAHEASHATQIDPVERAASLPFDISRLVSLGACCETDAEANRAFRIFQLEHEIHADRMALAFAKSHPDLFESDDQITPYALSRTMDSLLRCDYEHATMLALTADNPPEYGTMDSWQEAEEAYDTLITFAGYLYDDVQKIGNSPNGTLKLDQLQKDGKLQRMMIRKAYQLHEEASFTPGSDLHRLLDMLIQGVEKTAPAYAASCKPQTGEQKCTASQAARPGVTISVRP